MSDDRDARRSRPPSTSRAPSSTVRRGATSPAAMSHAGARPAARARSGRTPTPCQYVMIAVVLVVITAVEIAVSYIEGDIPDGLIVVLLLGDGGREVLPGRVVVHAPAHRPAGVPAVLHHRVRSPRSCSTSIVLATLHGVLAS